MSTRQLMGRRQFLMVSSACAVATAVAGPKLFAAERGAPPRSLAIGFVPSGETGVRPASDIVAGDGGFIGRGARVSISGASGASVEPAERRAVEILTHFSYLDGATRKSAPFRAWGCSRVSGCQGSPVSFTVPVDEVQQIEFSVETERGRPTTAATRREVLSGETADSLALPVTLSVQSGEGLKLARGAYVIVPLYDNDREPRWSAYKLAQVEGRWVLTDGDGNVASFEHFVLRIDYAS